MTSLHLDSPAGVRLMALRQWREAAAPDNQEQLERLCRNLRLARQAALTGRQQQLLQLYYDEGMTMAEIAQMLRLNPSTVSRTLRRARERLYRCLCYSL